MGDDASNDIRDANHRISRGSEAKAPARKGKLFAGRREELALSPTGGHGSEADGERKLRRASKNNASQK